jgi:rare lipoprotein A
MNKIMLAVPVFLICSYFQAAEAFWPHSVNEAPKNAVVKADKVAKHTVATKHKAKHYANNQRSTVSWYGPEFHGKKTASGQTYDMYAMTAAHKSLPLLSYAKVTNLKNHRSIVVRINDRNAVHGNRAMDLSYAAAQKLGISGLGAVEITPLSRKEALSSKASKHG